MNLIWVIIPLVLFSIVRIQESFAEEDIVKSTTILQATSTDSSMNVEITASSPKEGETMSVGLKFVYAKSGGIVRHVNYDLLAIQGEQIVLEETRNHNHKGLGKHKRMVLASNDPVDVTVTFQGIGTDPPLKGPIGDEVRVTVVPVNSGLNIPDWLRNNTKWWSEGTIDDSNFISGIQFMIKENIIVIPYLPEDSQEIAIKSKAIKSFSHGAKMGWIELDSKQTTTIVAIKWISKGYDHTKQLAKSK